MGRLVEGLDEPLWDEADPALAAGADLGRHLGDHRPAAADLLGDLVVGDPVGAEQLSDL